MTQYCPTCHQDFYDREAVQLKRAGFHGVECEMCTKKLVDRLKAQWDKYQQLRGQWIKTGKIN